MKLGEISPLRLLRPAMFMVVALATMDSLYWIERFHYPDSHRGFYSLQHAQQHEYNDGDNDDTPLRIPQKQTIMTKKEELLSSATNTQPPPRQVYFLDPKQLSDVDGFSASWLQRTDDFLEMKLKGIVGCEQASFMAYRPRKHKLRMPIDWLDFSIEHLSKWWKTLDVFHPTSSIGYEVVKQKLDNYIANKNTSSFLDDEDDPPRVFEQAIAVIAFQAYHNKQQPERGGNLTVLSLAATIKSLWRAGMGRVVVAGLEDGDPPLVQRAFEYLQNATKHSGNPVVGHMEVAYAKASPEDAETSFMKKNLPRAALFGLHHAIKYGRLDPAERSQNQTEHMKLWLGESHDPSYWKYAYLTEPDCILQSRPGSLMALKEQVDKGMVVVPHRLQPVPHESDLGSGKEHPHVPATGNFSTVLSLDSIGDHDACCDEQGGPKQKPALRGEPDPFLKSCGTFWYMCPFWYPKKDNPTFGRFEPYGFVRLTQGTGIATLASTEHGRRCFPQKNTVCTPRGQQREESSLASR